MVKRQNGESTKWWSREKVKQKKMESWKYWLMERGNWVRMERQSYRITKAWYREMCMVYNGGRVEWTNNWIMEWLMDRNVKILEWENVEMLE